MKGLIVSLLLTGLCQAVGVYLHPDPHVLPRLPAARAGAVLSKHLDLERFEDTTLLVGEQELLFGGSSSAGVLLTISSEDAKHVLPHSLKKHSFSITPEPSYDSLSTLIPTYIDRAHHVYSYVYDRPSDSNAMREFANLKDFLEGDYTPNRFGAFDFTSLSQREDYFGPSHDQVYDAHKALHEILSALIEKSDIKVAVVTIPPAPHHEHEKRQPPEQSPLPAPLPRPAEPIDSISTCYPSADTCGNATSSCSGHGQCVEASKAGKTCFVCACGATKDKKGRTERWAGSSCERKDVSGPFVLLAGTAVTLLVLVFGSVTLLSGIGGEKLPSTLIGGVGHGSR